uniref:Nudix hydrolase domain-containing protein n=1 Tax=Kalanchoe fedtschenkoi TaxID=63787 RepID=A0A7N0TQE7_KALFE
MKKLKVLIHLDIYNRCIPYKVAGDGEGFNSDWQHKLKVLMVSSPNRNDLVFPKGGWEDDETAEEAASREALEEAGVRGILKKNILGIWEFRSKTREKACCLKGGCRGYMYALEVTEELDNWPEQGDRSRKWLTIEEASELCRYDWMRHALEKFLQLMSDNMKAAGLADYCATATTTLSTPNVMALVL